MDFCASTAGRRPEHVAGGSGPIVYCERLGPLIRFYHRQAPRNASIDFLNIESVGYDGSTGELELAFHPLGITSLAAEAATIGQQAEGAAA